MAPGDEQKQKLIIDGLTNGKMKAAAYDALREQFAFANSFRSKARQKEADAKAIVKEARAIARFDEWKRTTNIKQVEESSANIGLEWVERGQALVDLKNTRPEIWGGLTLPARTALQKIEDDRIANRPRVMDAKAWRRYNLYMTMPPEALKGMDMPTIASQLVGTPFDQVRDRKIKAGNNELEKTDFTANQLLQGRIKALGWTNSEGLLGGDNQAKAAGELTVLYHEAIADEKIKLKTSNLLQKDKLRVLDEVSQIYIKATPWYSFSSVETTTLPEELAGLSVKDRAKIIATIQKTQNIKVPTQKNIQDFLKKQKGLKPL